MALLIGNYIVLTVILIAVLFFCIFLFFILAAANLSIFDVRQIHSYDDLLESGKYDEFPSDQLLGENGFTVVLNNTGNVIYNPSGQTIDLAQSDLIYVLDYLDNASVVTDELSTSSGKNYQITYTIYGEEEGEENKTIYVLDENYIVLYATDQKIANQLSQKEYDLLTDKYFGEYVVRKYTFKNRADAAEYTALLFRYDDTPIQLLQHLGKAISESFLLFVVIYLSLILCLIFWLKRKITKPLKLLRQKLNEFTIGSAPPTDYRGPREFCEIFESYSAMAWRLESSEMERRRLEAEKNKILADIAHDLKTPITVLQGYAKVLNDGLVSPVEQQKYFATIERKAVRLNALIHDFYEYSKMEHPDYRLCLERFDICNYFRDYIAEVYSELETAGYPLYVDIPELHVICEIDRGQLKRVFNNIVGNSVKHNRAETALLFALAEMDDRVMITIADDGAGIPPELAQNIFQPFVVGDETRGGGSSGLGLSIAKRIIEAHRGTISLADGNDSRWKTKFIILLPKAE